MRLWLIGLLALLALAGCGSDPGDLLAVDRAGSIPGATLRVVVNAGGTVACNGGEAVRLPEDVLLEARDVERELEPAAEEGLTLEPAPGSVLRYEVGTPTGDIAFADNSRGKPEAADRLAFLVRQIAQDVCRLPR